MQRRIGRVALGVGLASTLLLTSCASGGSEGEGDPGQTYTLKFNHVLSENEPFHQAFLDWAAAVEERTDGGLTIEVYPSAQLGVEEDIIEQMRAGANVGQNTDAARLGQYVEELAVVNGPYFFDGLDEVWALADSESFQGYLEELEGQGLKVISFNWVQGPRHFFTNGEVDEPSDLAGQRIRTPGAPIWQESIRALGAEPVAMGFGDMYSGLQQGAIDGAELVYANIPGANLFEVLDTANETGHILLVNFEVVSASWFDSLPEEYQEILLEEADNAGRAVSEEIEGAAADIVAQLEAEGMTINSDPDVDAFRDAGEGAYEALGLTDIKQQIWDEIGK